MSNAISVRNISKQFNLSTGKYITAKERFLHLGKNQSEIFHALNDVSFDVPEGTTCGLVGHNGSGKSTMLKIIGGILRPTSGEVVTKGRIAALLELGACMQPDLTGRENIFLNGSILGLSEKELKKRFDEIVSFSELEKFIDTQVRFYSSGMYVRLGFSVAVNVDPDILLVDEVLAVGDELFQRKCLSKVKDFQEEGRTIIVVTHSADLLRVVANSAVVLEKGNLINSGDVSTAIRVFRENLFRVDREDLEEPISLLAIDDKAIEENENKETKTKSILSVNFASSEDNNSLTPIKSGDTLKAVIEWENSDIDTAVLVVIEIFDTTGRLLLEERVDFDSTKHEDSKYSTAFEWKNIPLSDGTYITNVGITSKDGTKIYDWVEQEYSFQIKGEGTKRGSISIPCKSETTML